MKKITTMKNILLITILTLIAFLACKKDDYDVPAASSKADFSYIVSNNAIAPATVEFQNKSINTNYFEWDFGIGEPSLEENPTFTYEVAGTYEVTLTIEPENDVYYNILTKTVNIKIKDKPLRSLFYSNRFDNKVYFANIDDEAAVPQELGNFTVSDARFLTIDSVNGYAYISDKSGKQIIKAAVDGSSSESIITMNENPWGITVANDKVYYATENGDGNGGIWSCNLDGSNPAEVALLPGYLPLGLTYNTADEMLYFANDGYYADIPGGIHRINTDGTGLEVVIANQGSDPVDGAGIAIDQKRQKIFYSHYAAKGVFMADIDGTSTPVMVGAYSNEKLCFGIAIDPDEGYVYYSDRPASDENNGNIFRVKYIDENGNISVGSRETWIAGMEDLLPYGLAIDKPR
jgi:PKD repeat protein